jgi:hemerythrin-like metal-binding protein
MGAPSTSADVQLGNESARYTQAHVRTCALFASGARTRVPGLTERKPRHATVRLRGGAVAALLINQTKEHALNLITWDDSFTIGDVHEDADHRHFVALLNELDDALRLRHPPRVIAQVLYGLATHARRHFEHEEEQMLTAGYPDRAVHQWEHQRLKQRLVEVQRTLWSGEAPLTVDVLLLLRMWLLPHLRAHDVPLASWLARQRARDAA